MADADRLIELFTEAKRRPPGPDRDSFLAERCREAPDLKDQVLALLQADEEAGDFLKPTPLIPPGAPLIAQAGEWIGRYRLIESIGEGGCGVVYMADQEEPVRRRVALKVIKLGMDTRQVLARFEAERQALAMMDHPNIARVLDAGATDTGRPFFVMELVRGIKITEFCDHHQLSTVKRLDVFIQVCQAIQHAHQKGIIHRDIKPSNILVIRDENVTVPKVIDFGIAKATSDQRLTDMTLFTAFEQFMGTPAYMSPEQTQKGGLDIDTRTDIYSLGVLLYELLTGRTPFDAQQLMAAGVDAMRNTICEKAPPRPSTRVTQAHRQEAPNSAGSDAAPQGGTLNIPTDLDWIVMKCLEKERGRRYQTANGLATDLKRHLGHEPVLARPPSRVYRFQKLIRRHRGAAFAVAAVVLTLVLGAVVSTWQAVRATHEQRTAETARTRADAEKAEAARLLYVANMTMAQQAWEQNNISRLRQLLEETQASPDRGFEWFYWQRQCHLELKTLRGHLQAVTSAGFSPDGRWIVTGSFDQTAKVWETVSGRELLPLKGHSAPINSVAFSPDGQRIVTGSWDKTAKVWEAASGRRLLTLEGHTAPITCVAFSPDSQRIVTGGFDETARVWEAASGRHLLTFKEHAAQLWTVAFSSDGQKIVSGSQDHTARVWDAASGRKLLTLEGHSDGVRSAVFSPDGQRILTGGYEGQAKMWEASSGRGLFALKAHSVSVDSVAFSSDGERILTGSGDETAKVWEAASGRELFTLKGHSGTGISVAFSPDGRRIVTSSNDQTAKVWEAAGGGELPILTGHKAPIWSVAVSPDSQRVVTGSEDHTAKVWEAATGRELLTLLRHRVGIRSVAFSPDGQRIVTGSADHTAKVWEAASGRGLFTLTGHRAGIRSVAFSPDSQRIVTGSFDRTAMMWEAASGRKLLTFGEQTSWIRCVAFSPDGERIVTGSGDQTATVWDAASAREVLTLTGHSGLIRSVAFSPDGLRIVTGSDDQTAKLWEAASGRELFTLKGHSAGILSVAFSPDGRRIVTGSEDETAKLWETVGGRELLTLKAHGGSVLSVAFFPDGQRIVTGSDDQTAKVWEAARAEQVAGWIEEEQAAKEHLAGLQREWNAEQERQRLARALDEGAIKRWLILAPITLVTGQSGAAGLEVEQIEGEGRLRPKAGEVTVIGSNELKWQEVAQEDYVIDLNAMLEHITTHSVAYAVCYIRSEADQPGLRMLVGTNDQGKVYLNGRQIHRCAFSRPLVPDQDVINDITLSAGLNVLVFKLVNEFADWQGCIRFTDTAGNRVRGIRVVLDPG